MRFPRPYLINKKTAVGGDSFQVSSSSNSTRHDKKGFSRPSGEAVAVAAAAAAAEAQFTQNEKDFRINVSSSVGIAAKPSIKSDKTEYVEKYLMIFDVTDDQYEVYNSLDDFLPIGLAEINTLQISREIRRVFNETTGSSGGNQRILFRGIMTSENKFQPTSPVITTKT
jgi:hypothetical protein